jgi:hypothetical protein
MDASFWRLQPLCTCPAAGLKVLLLLLVEVRTYLMAMRLLFPGFA